MSRETGHHAECQAQFGPGSIGASLRRWPAWPVTRLRAGFGRPGSESVRSRRAVGGGVAGEGSPATGPSGLQPDRQAVAGGLLPNSSGPDGTGPGRRRSPATAGSRETYALGLLEALRPAAVAGSSLESQAGVSRVLRTVAERAAPRSMGVMGSELVAPAAARLVGDGDPSLGQQVLDVPGLRLNRSWSQTAYWMISGGNRCLWQTLARHLIQRFLRHGR